MTETTVTPNDMPGADTAEAPETVETTETSAVEQAPEKGLPPDKLAELNRKLRDEKKAAERRARELEQRAQQADQRWQQLASLFGDKADGNDGFDPQAEIQRMRSDLEAERTERLRSDVARTTGVEPDFISGSSMEEMQASAQRYLDSVNARIEAAMKAKNIPVAPPASTVTSDGKIAGPDQITSREELAKLSPAERAKAYEEGRLDTLMGKTT